MEFQQLAARACELRALYAEREVRRDGRSWSSTDLMNGFVGDVGDLSKLMAAHAGVRPGPTNLTDALGHELADCLWSVLAANGICPLAAISGYPETASFVTERD